MPRFFYPEMCLLPYHLNHLKLFRHHLRGLGGTPLTPFQEIKNTETLKFCHAYQFVLRGNEGGGTYLTDESDLDAARYQLLKRYGDWLLLVTNAAPD